jgi:hypothetical protein
MTAASKPRQQIENAEDELFIVFDGVRIAKYGKPLSGYFGQWIPLEPGYEVFCERRSQRDRHQQAWRPRSLKPIPARRC